MKESVILKDANATVDEVCNVYTKTVPHIFVFKTVSDK